MRTGLLFADRTAVLFLGVAAGAAIGYAFGANNPAPPQSQVATSSAKQPGGAPPTATAGRVPAKPAPGLEYAQPFQPHLLQALADDRPVTVGVFGDSFGDGVWSALYRLLPAHEKYRVLKYSQQSTGFTRYRTRNLEEHAAARIAADGPVDIAVISFGANDTQGIYADGHAAPLMSPEWQRIVGGRIEGFVRLMRSRGATVYWLGLPKMRTPAFDADIAGMNDFYERQMKVLRVPFIDIRPLTVDAAGGYAPYLPDPISHEMRLMRANDGIHMSMNGYVAITRPLAGRIKDYVTAARVSAGVPAVVPPPAAKPVVTVKLPEQRPAAKLAPVMKPKPVAVPNSREEPRRPEPAPSKPVAETPPRSKPETPIAKPKAEPAPTAKPKPDAAAPSKPRSDTPPAAKPKAETPVAKPKAEPTPAKPKPDTAPKSSTDTKPKTESKAPAKTSTDKPAAKPATTATPKAPASTTSKPPAAATPRAPLQLNLPPPEESRRSPSAPPPTDQP